MRKTILNIAALLVIGLGGYSLSTPTVAYACPDCRTCTGGCLGCFGEDCVGDGIECGKIENVNTGELITCREGDGEDLPEEN